MALTTLTVAALVASANGETLSITIDSSAIDTTAPASFPTTRIVLITVPPICWTTFDYRVRPSADDLVCLLTDPGGTTQVARLVSPYFSSRLGLGQTGARCAVVEVMGSMIVRVCAAVVAVACVLGPRPAEAQCAYTVNPLTVNALSTGLSASISVIAGTSCTWTATSPDSWITVAGGTHAGLGSVNYTVAVNSTSAARTGTIAVAGQTVTVNQAFGSCNFTVNPLTVNALSTGLSASISVIAGSSCTWTATSPDSWITVAGGSHAGLGSVNYTVAVNSTSAARTGTMTVAGKTVTVNQAFGSCNYTVNPLTVNAPSTGLQRQRLGDRGVELRVDGHEPGQLDHRRRRNAMPASAR